MHTTTNQGLHDFVAERVLASYARPARAVDLGSGPGAMALRLHSFGCDVLAADRTAEGFKARRPHVALDFDQNDFASLLGPASFDLVTAIEVIEHVESPIGFLRNIGRLLAPRGRGGEGGAGGGRERRGGEEGRGVKREERGGGGREGEGGERGEWRIGGGVEGSG